MQLRDEGEFFVHLAVRDIDRDGRLELIVGSADLNSQGTGSITLHEPP